ncbi:MAG: putative glycosyl transferase [Segetibacter sp.]|nr:putative glycosyl transferase [Segetibacter sp.]
MAKRIKLGLIFTVNDGWLGGTYYILNLISALKKLPPDKQPLITILTKSSSNFIAAKKTGYPFLDHINPYSNTRNLVERIIDKFSKIILKKYIIDKRISSKKITVLFPASDEYVFGRIKNKVYWFPDFQHIVYPDFFSSKELSERNLAIERIAKSRHDLVLSSKAARANWDSLPIAKNCSVHTIPFAVTHPPIDDIKIEHLLDEFQIKKDYIIICNQFWRHKNHLLVLKAMLQLREQGMMIQFVFTGNEDDYRNPGYFKSIVDFISEHDLNSFVKILGLIDRRKQLKLMQYSTAVIQPSLFEGWSTVIEDAKSLGCKIIASDIAVHKEQLQNTAYFFDPNNETDLIAKIKECISSTAATIPIQYEKNIVFFGEKFFEMIEEITVKS